LAEQVGLGPFYPHNLTNPLYHFKAKCYNTERIYPERSRRVYGERSRTKTNETL